MPDPAATLTALLRERIIVIFRGESTAQAAAAAKVLYEAGLRAFEVTLNSDQPLRTLDELRRALPDDALVGAGTVMSPADVSQVAESGAQFVISPHLDPDIVTATKSANLVSIPGAFTATEIWQAHRAGADIVKVFPIAPVGAAYVRQLRGPFSASDTGDPRIRLIVTGGVTPTLAADCLAAGADLVAFGSHMLGAGAIARSDWGGLAAAAADYRKALAGRAAD